MPDQALELSFEPASDAAVVAQWEALKAAGVPSQADHRSMTNAPHLTLVAAVGIGADVLPVAREAIAPLLPARLGVRGLVLFGQGARVTIAHLIEPEPALAAATARIRELVPSVRHPVWTPHVTLARRVPRRLLPAALDVLDSTEAPADLVCDRLHWWDPAQNLIETIAIG
ncbi:2'-5' RNA ligase family protein [Aeromicrobium duanguangcaii]|uniref:2'-5' RNA ligase family protein n=1 Tax=Aeromicrobium duanguangcaii TaxID=2968086 RepID=A0ABY5KJJ3_9ACTN|nr:2'-5' RNA ligase family protein [Aeromicrobium duanguangcaii]MCD9152961.1 2'-5' RNA ligase family protein [Aeromicrobium duanguangcaii]UUI69933.1 2'-5' RNA ligase family protein [Aeromicrobium duanguangcaii]